jgi:hypothetical protein
MTNCNAHVRKRRPPPHRSVAKILPIHRFALEAQSQQTAPDHKLAPEGLRPLSESPPSQQTTMVVLELRRRNSPGPKKDADDAVPSDRRRCCSPTVVTSRRPGGRTHDCSDRRYPSAVEFNGAVEFANPSNVPNHISNACPSSAVNTFPSIAKSMPRYMSLRKHKRSESNWLHVTAHCLLRRERIITWNIYLTM